MIVTEIVRNIEAFTYDSIYTYWNNNKDVNGIAIFMCYKSTYFNNSIQIEGNGCYQLLFPTEYLVIEKDLTLKKYSELMFNLKYEEVV